MFLKLLFSIIIANFTSSLFVLYYCYILNISFMRFIAHKVHLMYIYSHFY